MLVRNSERFKIKSNSDYTTWHIIVVGMSIRILVVFIDFTETFVVLNVSRHH